ncbi:MAG: hypothetical protein U0939_02055 [Pirellulales bacterium]
MWLDEVEHFCRYAGTRPRPLYSKLWIRPARSYAGRQRLRLRQRCEELLHRWPVLCGAGWLCGEAQLRLRYGTPLLCEEIVRSLRCEALLPSQELLQVGLRQGLCERLCEQGLCGSGPDLRSQGADLCGCGSDLRSQGSELRLRKVGLPQVQQVRTGLP